MLIVAKARFDPEEWQKERFAPLPAALFIRRLCGGVADWRACSPSCQECRFDPVVFAPFQKEPQFLI